jgi:hypothetical protein
MIKDKTALPKKSGLRGITLPMSIPILSSGRHKVNINWEGERMTKKKTYRRLDSETLKEITGYVREELEKSEDELIKRRHDKQRANVKLLLRSYRDITLYVNEAIADATQSSDDISLHDLLVLMGSSKGTFRAESIKEGVATARLLINHMDKMLDTYRHLCNKSKKEECKRRSRVLDMLYISHDKKTADEIAAIENIDRVTVYRDIDAAAEKLTVLFFGLQGLNLL